MTSLDLHPEELFDKKSAGTLSDDEALRLEQHLAACAVCRFEVLARADFAALPSVALNVDGLVSRALSGLPTVAPVTARARSRRSGAYLAAAAVALSAFASFAAVGQWTGVLPRVLAAFRAPEPEPVLPPAPSRAFRQPAPPAVVVPELEVVVPEAPLPPAPVVVKHAAKVAPAAPELPKAELPADPATLFHLANEARIRGDRYQATQRYRELLRLHPEAPEAQLTRATLGRLLLDSGDSLGALDQLDTYLASGDDTLREEALAARAQALGRLGRDADEAHTWKQLLDRYPDSIHAAHAQARLGALQAP